MERGSAEAEAIEATEAGGEARKRGGRGGGGGGAAATAVERVGRSAGARRGGSDRSDGSRAGARRSVRAQKEWKQKVEMLPSLGTFATVVGLRLSDGGYTQATGSGLFFAFW